LCVGLLLPQCTNELLEPHVMPGGVVRASIDGGALVAAQGLCTITADPITLNAASGDLSFGLIGGSDAGGRTAFSVLAGPNTAITLPIAGTTQLQVYAGGGGCVAATGSVVLSIDANGNAMGTVTASGTRSDGVTACNIDGAISAVPVQR
jgi:hypothetical protein